MEPIRPLTALGLMSGTSLDGVDAALLVTDGVDIFEKGAGLCRPYDMDMRAELKSVMGDQARLDGERVKEVERKMTLFHAQVVEELLDSAGIDVVSRGFDGESRKTRRGAEHRRRGERDVDRRKRGDDRFRHGSRKRADRRMVYAQMRHEFRFRRQSGGVGRSGRKNRFRVDAQKLF